MLCVVAQKMERSRVPGWLSGRYSLQSWQLLICSSRLPVLFLWVPILFLKHLLVVPILKQENWWKNNASKWQRATHLVSVHFFPVRELTGNLVMKVTEGAILKIVCRRFHQGTDEWQGATCVAFRLEKFALHNPFKQGLTKRIGTPNKKALKKDRNP